MFNYYHSKTQPSIDQDFFSLVQETGRDYYVIPTVSLVANIPGCVSFRDTRKCASHLLDFDLENDGIMTRFLIRVVFSSYQSAPMRM